MENKFVYDKYGSNIDITYKKQRVAQTGQVQTVLVLKVLEKDGEGKEIVLGSLENMESFKDGTLSRDIKDILQDGQMISEINSLVEEENQKGVDDKFTTLYDSLKSRNFYFTKEGYRLLNANSKERLDTVTTDDITVNLSDKTNEAIQSKYELFKTNQVFEQAEKVRGIREDLGDLVKDSEDVSKEDNIQKTHAIIDRIIEHPEVIDKPPYNRIYQEMKGIVEFQCGATKREAPQEVQDVINAFIVIYDTAKINKMRKPAKKGPSNEDKPTR